MRNRQCKIDNAAHSDPNGKRLSHWTPDMKLRFLGSGSLSEEFSVKK